MKTKDEDRSKNLIFFGLEETNNPENSRIEIEEVINELNLKPRLMNAYRFGKSQEDRPRPIRVNFESIGDVHEVLKCSKNLKSSSDYNHVFVSVDRSPDQQKQHKELVKKLKDKITEQPRKRWYIKNGQILCDDFPVRSEKLELNHDSESETIFARKIDD